MNIRFYLNDSFKSLAECTAVERYDNHRKWKEYFLGHGSIRVYQDNYRYYFQVSEMEDSIPTTIRELVVDVSIHDSFNLEPNRTIGLYAATSSDGSLDRKPSSYELKLRGTRIECVLALYRLIREGRAKPRESWDEPQIK